MSTLPQLDKYQLAQVPDCVYYIPNFITEEEEQSLLQNVNSAPKPKWTQLSKRRLQNWGGLPHPKGMVPEKLPQWLEKQCNRIAELGVFEGCVPNHVLVNEYLPGQGIMPHTDGPLYFPTVTTISLGSHTVFDFYRSLSNADGDAAATMQSEVNTDGAAPSASLERRHVTSLLLEPRSLVVLRDVMYTSHLHGIAERTHDVMNDDIANLAVCRGVTAGETLARTIRVSLTIRVVPKVLKTKITLSRS